jgi:hypothetical protein
VRRASQLIWQVAKQCDSSPRSKLPCLCGDTTYWDVNVADQSHLAAQIDRSFIVDGESVVEGDPPHLRFGRRDPALPDPQGAHIMERLSKEHHAATRSVLRQAWELDDTDKAEKLIRNHASTRPAMARRSGQHPRRPRRNPDRRPIEAAEGAPSIARLYQHSREHDGHHSPRHAQRQTLAGCRHCLAMGRGRHDRGQQGLPTIEGA